MNMIFLKNTKNEIFALPNNIDDEKLDIIMNEIELIQIPEVNAISLSNNIDQSEHAWVKSELDNVQVELMYHWTDDERASSTEEEWKQYARDLRNYTTTDENGNPQIREGETRPLRPTE
ncbi:hypothetical protein MRM63_13765 [bacterium 19MO03SA05]|uniref:Uncharacterized protein n=1 Tax=bacterium 19MO03SA05 TaxID=2920620 RepID=A0AAU6VIW4_UNCXX